MKLKLSGIASRLTFSNVVAVIALFIALGGASYAAVKLPKNSVGTKQIKTGAVNSKKVKDRSLLAKDFKKGQLPRGAVGPTGSTGSEGQSGAPGMVGATGAQGPIGLQGPTGSTGVAGDVGPTGETGATGEAGTSSAAVMSAHTQSGATGGYFAVSGVTSTSLATKEDVVTISPATPVTARNLAVRIPENFSPGSSFTVQLLDDGVPVLSCTANFVNFSTPSTCQNTAGAATISPGSELVLRGINSNVGFARVDVAFTLGP